MVEAGRGQGKLPEGGGMQWKGCKLLQNTEEEPSDMEIELKPPVILLVDATESSNNAIVLDFWSGCVQNGTILSSLIMLRYTCVCRSQCK